jgi:hypothetical protein
MTLTISLFAVSQILAVVRYLEQHGIHTRVEACEGLCNCRPSVGIGLQAGRCLVEQRA